MVKTPLLSTDLVKRVPFPQCSVDLRCTSGRFAKNTTPFFVGRGDIGSGAAGGSAENAPGTALAWSGSSDHRLVVGSCAERKAGSPAGGLAAGEAGSASPSVSTPNREPWADDTITSDV